VPGSEDAAGVLGDLHQAGHEQRREVEDSPSVGFELADVLLEPGEAAAHRLVPRDGFERCALGPLGELGQHPGGCSARLRPPLDDVDRRRLMAELDAGHLGLRDADLARDLLSR
jgi:hypothetical protein